MSAMNSENITDKTAYDRVKVNAAWARRTVDAMSDEQRKCELEKYMASGVTSDELHEVVALFPWERVDIPTEIKGWAKRCTWYVGKCAQLNGMLLEKKREIVELKAAQRKPQEERRRRIL